MMNVPRISRLTWFCMELHQKFTMRWSETPLVIVPKPGDPAQVITAMIWNARYKRIELRTKPIENEVYPTHDG